MSTEKSLTLTFGTPAAAGADEDAGADEEAGADEDAGVDVVEVDDEQPAAIRAATPATATHPKRERGLFLLPRSIPYTFRRNASGYTDAGHRRTRVLTR